MKKNSEFVKLVDRLKIKHQFSHYRIAYVLGIDRSTMSHIYKGHNGCTGRKHLAHLKEMIQVLEVSEEEETSTEFYCVKCNNAHKFHPKRGECYS